MAKPLSAINVIDVESTCWEGDPPFGQKSEIIQVGIVQIRLPDLSIQNSGYYYVVPEQSEISDFCTELTGITAAVLQEQNAIPFEQLCATLRSDWRTAQLPWASYGDYDRAMFERSCTDRGTPKLYPFGTRHINVKTLAGLLLGLPSEVGMDVALQILGLELVGRHHDALDDARNITEILRKVLVRLTKGI